MLNVALDTPLNERERTVDLNVGFDSAERTWELIVRYKNSLDELREKYTGILIEELAGNFAIIVINENYVDRLAEEESIIYMEKPKNFYYQIYNAKASACITPVQIPPYNLFGEGVLVAIIDSGIDIYHKDFQNDDNTTRILSLWDQTISGNPPKGYLYGSVYTYSEINEAITKGKIEGRSIVPSLDTSGHGTSVAGIAVGNGRESAGLYAGVAKRASIIVVKLGTGNASFPKTTRIMEAIDYVNSYAKDMNMPLVINLSFGNNYGSHNGNSIFEEYIDYIASENRISIVTGSGNEGNADIHTSGVLSDREEIVEFVIGEYETKLNIQIWKEYADTADIFIETPLGNNLGPFDEMNTVLKYSYANSMMLVYNGTPTPYNRLQEIYVDIIPRESYILSGVYRIHIIPKKIISGEYYMWLPGNTVIGNDTGFLRPKSDGTFTIPSTASRVISVGAYNSDIGVYADFSGRGFDVGNIKPDIVAAGVDVVTAKAGGGYDMVTGTSFATPIVSGSAAIMMEWGIIRGNDIYLYGERLKAAVYRGAGKLLGIIEYPNAKTGWGTLCVKDSLIEL